RLRGPCGRSPLHRAAAAFAQRPPAHGGSRPARRLDPAATPAADAPTPAVVAAQGRRSRAARLMGKGSTSSSPFTAAPRVGAADHGTWLRAHAGGAECRHIREEIVHEPTEEPRRAVLLGLQSPADADSLIHLGEARKAIEPVHDAL